MASMWGPWRGCHKCSDGCLHCYIHKGDEKRGINTDEIVKTKDFSKPVEKKKNGEYKMKSGLVYLCFSTDFLIEEADIWRRECWQMIKERQDCTFLFLTKRIDRFMDCIPDDRGDGYDNVVICCTIENQKNADYKLDIFKDLPIKHKQVTAQPLISDLDIENGYDAEKLSGEIRKQTGLYLSAGNQYGSNGKEFLRMNIACPKSILSDGLDRLRSGISMIGLNEINN